MTHYIVTMEAVSDKHVLSADCAYIITIEAENLKEAVEKLKRFTITMYEFDTTNEWSVCDYINDDGQPVAVVDNPQMHLKYYLFISEVI